MRARAARATRWMRGTTMCHSERLSGLSRDARGQRHPTSWWCNPTCTRPAPNLAPATAGAHPTCQPFAALHVRACTRACTWRAIYLHLQVGIYKKTPDETEHPTSTQPQSGRVCVNRSGLIAGNAVASTTATQCDGSSPGRVYCGPQSREIPPRSEEIVRLIRGLAVNRAGLR